MYVRACIPESLPRGQSHLQPVQGAECSVLSHSLSFYLVVDGDARQIAIEAFVSYSILP